jgi:dolichol-phosphate mannosyltransferase
MDCDDTHDPAQIVEMTKLIEGGVELVIASRFTRGAITIGIPFYRRLASLGAMCLLKAIHPISGVWDYTCGYRAYRSSLLKKATQRFGNDIVSERGFACMVELLVKLKTFSPKVAEIPLKLRYDLKPTESKMDVGGYIKQLLWLIVEWRFKGFKVAKVE